MTLVLGLLGTAVLIGALGPVYLRGLMSPRFGPGTALAGWLISMFAAIASFYVATALLVLPHGLSADGLIGMAAACVNTGRHLWETVLRLLLAGLAVALTVRTCWVAVRMGRSASERGHQHLTALRLLGHTEGGDREAVFWLPESTPVAYSLGGRRGAVVATTGVARLDGETRRAILAHEHAHLRGRHHRLVLLAEIASRVLCFVPLFRTAPSAIRVLVELAADSAAARVCGRDGVRNALRTVGSERLPTISLAMSREAIELRLRWLEPRSRFGPNRVGRGMGYPLAAFTSLSPAVLALGATAGAVLWLCLLTAPPI
ncbi:Signal transducer regulating beta-lactamase production, contains metallopeptidase domain [Actinopolyspora mzabensis]|uniref:Signal transducer regulating beta-lactamase production, contains metallopeptidase domain n=1 Tax=Actinopolyspora mzabensis TaxID=995066 RepID=A0A1G9AJI2_ACTMZ|nr:M56 family metallopeptidase [Actinopolyspora mzabensis]SDK26964.1 Signal transducer regulating beta-lactamase production, contains metallopeptidase domain [Actinopolyspora mzabensis]